MVTWLHHQFLTWPVYLLFKEMIALRGSLVSWQKRRLNFLAYKLTLLLYQGKLVLLMYIITTNIHRNPDLNRLKRITISSEV